MSKLQSDFTTPEQSKRLLELRVPPDFYPAPTKAEAINWLESKGIVIIVDEYYIMREEDDYYTSCWGYYIRKDDEGVCRDNSSEYKTRLVAKDAAIIKACELLTNKN